MVPELSHVVGASSAITPLTNVMPSIIPINIFLIILFPLPVSDCVGYDKATSYNMYYDPKGLEEQGYSSFSKSQNRHIRTVMITLAHQVPGCPSPDLFDAVHSLQLSHDSSSRSKSISSSGASSLTILLPALFMRL